MPRSHAAHFVPHQPQRWPAHAGNEKQLEEIMSNALTTITEDELLPILQTSLYPGASIPSIRMVIGYCKAAGLDIMQKPVHIVPMYDRVSGGMRDVVMPGIGLYRTQASRSGECAGVSEPEFGDDVTESIGGVEVTYPKWCKVTVKRRLPTGEIVEFTAREFWKENYAVRGGKEKSVAPNAMWSKRPYGQVAKCAEAQALRKAFPEFGSQPVAEEMEGKSYAYDETPSTPLALFDVTAALDAVEACQTLDDLSATWKAEGAKAVAAKDNPGHAALKAAVKEKKAALESVTTVEMAA
jgi:phage recombination protein Bet